MADIAEVKTQAVRLFSRGDHLLSLRLCDAVIAAAPTDFEARLKAADCLAALGETALAAEVYREIGWYVLKAGHPLVAVVVARVLEAAGAEFDDLVASLVVRYGSESEFTAKMGARVPLPEDVDIPTPDLSKPAGDDFIAAAGARARDCAQKFDGYPESVHAIPLLSDLTEASFRKVLPALVVGRLPHGTDVIRQGEPGQSFFFVAGGAVEVVRTEQGTETELAVLREGSIFGEMALLSAEPRSATVRVRGEADLLEVTADSLRAIAGEIEQVAAALHSFTRDRLLANLMANHRLFRPFTRLQQRDLLRRFTSHEVAAGTNIIQQDDQGRGLFVVLSGEVEVVAEKGGQETPLATLRSGEVFGEMALLRGGETTATVRAATQTTVLFLARDYVKRMVAGVPAVRDYLAALAEDRELDTQLALGASDDELGEDEVIILI